jgi:hypothetical protein
MVMAVIAKRPIASVESSTKTSVRLFKSVEGKKSAIETTQLIDNGSQHLSAPLCHSLLHRSPVSHHPSVHSGLRSHLRQ